MQGHRRRQETQRSPATPSAQRVAAGRHRFLCPSSSAMRTDISLSSLRELDAVALATNVTVFMKRGTYIDEFRKAGHIREEYTGGRAPASTLLQIDQLASPDYLVEIEGIAVLEE